jgi:hypothetical protein
MVVLQKVVRSSCSESYPARTSSHDGDPVVNVKVEEVLDTEVGEDLPPVMYPGIKAEHEVSCMSVCPWCNIENFLLSFLSVCLSVHMKQLLGMDFQQSCLSVFREDCVLFLIACDIRLHIESNVDQVK